MPHKPAVNLGKTSVPRIPKTVPQRNVRTLDVQGRAVQALSIKVTPVNQPDSAGEATNLDFRVRYNQQSQLTQYSNYTAFDKQADDAANRMLNSANAWGGTGASQYSSQVQTGLKNFGVSSPVQQSYSRALEPETPMFGVNASNHYRSYSEAVQTGSFANQRYESDPRESAWLDSFQDQPMYQKAMYRPSKVPAAYQDPWNFGEKVEGVFNSVKQGAKDFFGVNYWQAAVSGVEPGTGRYLNNLERGGYALQGVAAIGGLRGVSGKTPYSIGGRPALIDDVYHPNVVDRRIADNAKTYQDAIRNNTPIAAPKHGVIIPPPRNGLPAFPNLERASPKTPLQGGGGLRARWKDSKGNIYEWDYQHGTIEKYNSRGNHLGEFNPNNGNQTKPADPTRKIKP